MPEAQIQITRQGDTLSSIAYRHYGTARGKVEAVLAANPRLCLYPAVLPAGIAVKMPPQPDTLPVRRTVNLWD
ncbi:MAG: tail protein X [Neisseria sp.]|nr:tail protein X [Neisseria sp.]